MKRLITLALLVSVSNLAVAGQFGLEQGMSLEQIRSVTSLKAEGPFIYSTSKVPDGHRAFDSYYLVITPVHGLCKIDAETPAIQSSAYGDEIKRAFSALFDALTMKYGSSNKIDLLKAGSIWDEPRDWMMGLLKGERGLLAFWSAKNNSTLPDDLKGIGLETTALSSTTSQISLGYDFKNVSDCLAWIKTQKDSSL